MQEIKRQRYIHKIWKSEPTIEEAGVHLREAFAE